MTSALRKKLLSLAIRGKLVPQDPADEPASVLLERIRAEREAKENESPRRGRGRRSSSDNPPCPKQGTPTGAVGVEGAVSEPPFSIPKSWVWTTLGEICEIETGTTPPTKDTKNYDGPVPFFKPSDLVHGRKVQVATSSLTKRGVAFARVFPEKTILVTCIGATIGKTGMVTVDGACNQQINAVIPGHVNQEYLMLVICSDEFQARIKTSAGQTTLPILNKRSFSSISVSLPPLAEQKRIVDRFAEISAICDSIDEDKTVLSDLAAKTRTRVLDLAIRGALVSQNPTDEPASTLLERIRSTADKPPCPKIPDTWEWTTIREINEYERKTLQPDPGSEEIFELYSVPVFESGLPEFVKGTEISSPKQVVRKGDVLVCKINPRINRVWNVAGHTDSRLLASSEWIVVRAKDIVSGYLKIVFQSPYFRAKLLTNVSGVGGSLMRAQAGFVMDYPFPIPPLAEQRRIVAKVDELFATIDGMLG